MKILIIRTFPDVMDLSKYNVQEIGLAKALTKKGHTCGILLYNGFHKSTVQTIPVEGTKRTIRIYWRRGINLLKNGFLPGIGKILKRYDVIQIDEYDLIQSWWLYSFGKKPVVVYHGPYECEFNKGYNLKCKVFDHTFLKLGKRKGVRFLTKSVLAEKFIRARGFDTVCTVGVGLDPIAFEGAAGRAWRRDAVNPACDETCLEKFQTTFAENLKYDTKCRLIYVGKLEERRNVFFLADVIRKLSKMQEAVTLTVIGSGEKEYVKRFLDDTHDLREAGVMQYIPSVRQQELADIYGGHDLMLFPTNYDIFGMVLLEAMYCGVPCLSSRNGGAETLIEDGRNGRIIDGFDVDEWCDAVRDLMADKEKLADMGREAAKAVCEHYTWDRIAEKFIEQYRLAIKDRLE